jgi:AmmeMemoRadiSam system protein A
MHNTEASSAPALPQLTPEEQRTLLKVAADSIENGLRSGRPLNVTPEAYSPTLQEPWAVFVTLHLKNRLRGCIGTIEPEQPLVMAVACNACYAGFNDSRFSRLTWEEWPDLDLDISILSRPEPLAVRSEAELLAALRPGVDGLVLEDFPQRATFLPAVWESLPNKVEFLQHLKRKAGMSSDHWSAHTRASRYVSSSFGARVQDL